MTDSQVLEKMRADWNARAKEDVRYYVAFGRRGQTEEEFFATAGGIVRQLEEELARFPSTFPPRRCEDSKSAAGRDA